MPDLTRRRALLAAASGVTALAGCTGEEPQPSFDSPSGARPLEDYDVRHVRNEDGAVLFAPGNELPAVSDDDRARNARTQRRVLVSVEESADLAFGDFAEATHLRTFVAATDFQTSSVYLHTMPVEACYEIRLRSVSVERDETDTDDIHPRAAFCRTHRPADVECRADEFHTVGFAIRLPVAAEQSTGTGHSMDRSCQQPFPREYFEAPVTPADGGEDE